MSYIGSYVELVRKFIAAGYNDIGFEDKILDYKSLLLRHDIDFDCNAALSLALIEKELGVQSTFFFMLTSSLYNPMHLADRKRIQQISDLGHNISLHFDPTVYDDYEKGFQQEVTVFETLFGVAVKTVSIHRPNDFFLSHNADLCGVKHTYQNKFFKDIKYISDSQGSFRYDNPVDNEAFNNGKSIQLLIHPIWWDSEAESNLEVLDEYVEKTELTKKREIALNCIPYRERMDIA